MSLVAFQHALADLVASPDLCRRLAAAPDSVLSRYPLTMREQARLTSVARDRGMAVNCSLYRASRLEALYTLLPLTCRALGADLQREIEQFWQFREHTDLQFCTEVAYWSEFLLERIRDAKLTNPYVREIVSYEVATSELRYAQGAPTAPLAITAESHMDGVWRLHPMVRVVRFDHDPVELLTALHGGCLPSRELARSIHRLVLDYRGDSLVASLLS